MSETPSATITNPTDRRIAYIGAAVGASVLAWGAVAATAPLSINDHLPHEIYNGLLGLAMTVSLVAVTLGVTYLCQRDNATNDRAIFEAIGSLAAEVEAVNGKVGVLDGKVGNLAGLYWQSVADEANGDVIPLRNRSN